MNVPVLRFSEGEPELGMDTLPVAFWGRTSTYELQDPTLSIPRQLSEVTEKMPVEAGSCWPPSAGSLPRPLEAGIDHRCNGRLSPLEALSPLEM
jgi:hypothetical protein